MCVAGRFCGASLRATMVDLGMSPLAKRIPVAEPLNRMEPFYPLHVWVCESCFLVQLEEYVGGEADLLRLRLLFILFRLVAGPLPPATSTR